MHIPDSENGRPDDLAESEKKYRELVEYANSIILRWDSQGRITFLNEFGQNFFGYTVEEILGRHVVGTIVPPRGSGDRDLGQLMDEICANPQAFAQNVNENIKRNGERVWIAWTNRVVHDANGSVLEILSIGTDITEQRRVEEALKQSEASYRKLFEYAPDGIVIADGQSYYLDANPSICRMLGYSREELIGKHAADIVAPAEIEFIDPALSEIKSVSDHQREWTFKRKDGTTFPAEVIATMMPDGNLLGMIRDISERKQAEAEREKRHRAEAADRIKSAFLATMSHELRTPLNSIIGFTGVILEGLAGPLNAEQSKQLGMVRTSANHLLALVNDVLDISRIEAGQMEVHREPFDVQRSVNRMADLVRPQAATKQLQLSVQIDPELREAVSDERRFEQILLNLLSNAIKFTERGEVRLKVDVVEMRRENSKPRAAVRLSISDTGIGIKPEHLGTIFQPFRQIDSGLARKQEGTGLGLVICRRLAELMGGEVRAESVWGKGSTFTCILPLQAP